MIYLNIHYEMRRHGLKGQQLAAVLGLPLNDVILADLFGCSLDYLVGHRVVTRAYTPGEGIDSIMRG